MPVYLVALWVTTLHGVIIIMIMSVFLERLSMLNCAEQGQIQKFKTHAYKKLKTAGVQTSMLKHPTKHLKKNKC